MEAKISSSFALPSQSPNTQQQHFYPQNAPDFNSIFHHFIDLLPLQNPTSSQNAPNKCKKQTTNTTATTATTTIVNFSSACLSIETQQNPQNPTKPTSQKFLKFPPLPFPNIQSSQNAPTKCREDNTTTTTPFNFSSNSIPIEFHIPIEFQHNPTKSASRKFLKIPLLPFPNFSSSRNAPTNCMEENTTTTSFSFPSISLPIETQHNPTKPISQKFLKLPLLPFPNIPSSQNAPTKCRNQLNFCSTSLSVGTEESPIKSTPRKLLKRPSTTKASIKMQYQGLMKSLSVLEKTIIGAMAGGIAGAFTYVCLHPLDTVKTKLQTKGASRIYSSALDAAVKTFQSQGILGFYSGVSAVIVGSTFSSAIYFGTCEFGKSVLSKLPNYPPLLIPPTAGAMGNIVSSAIMVPKELITQRMQAGSVTGRSWQVLLRILEKDGILGLYAGYSATLLRNLPAGVLSYSSFEYLKSAVLSRTGQAHLEPIQSVCCGALAGAISASLTTPMDVVKTRLMTQGDVAKSKIVASVYGGVSTMIRQILKEEGWVGLTRGMGPRVLHSACFAALGYFAFETARLTLLHQYVLRRKIETETVGACL